MTTSSDFSSASLLAALHAHALSGDPHERLSTALCELEHCDWALLLNHERALAAQLAAVLGKGTLRADPRLNLDTRLYAEVGLSVADLSGDWRGAVGVWLLAPRPADFRRAQSVQTPLLSDATWLPADKGAPHAESSPHAEFPVYRVYRSAAALSGFSCELAALLGRGERAPKRAGAAPADLTVSLLLRDLATLGVRLGESQRLAVARAAALGKRAEHLGGGLLWLAPESVPPTLTPLGGVLSASLPTVGGTLVSMGLTDSPEFWGEGLWEAQPEAEQSGLSEPDKAEPEPAPAPTEPEPTEPAPTEPAPAPLAPDLPAPEATDPTTGLDDAQHAAFMRLREWRNAEAARQEVSRFIVAANATLADIARAHPSTLEELSKVRGMGAARMSKYGAAILRVLG